MTDECWLEIDLYWFQGAPPEEKARELFDRVAPLWQREPAARTGLALCVGWLFDSVLSWNGRLDDTIVCCQAPTYEPWTYRRLGELVSAIRAEAERRAMARFHVAIMLMGIATQSFPESACEGWSGRTDEARDKVRYDIEGRWFPDHPEVNDRRFDLFYFGAPVRVPADEAVCADSRPALGTYFADKLCHLCRAVGLGAVVLRDHIFTRAYARSHSKGRYMAPDSRAAWNGAIIAMLRRIRDNTPEMVIIGYSSGTSAVEEWRSHGFDLEQVAGAGCLDLWITQTWASAWGDYWPAHSMGFTFQLQNALVQQAMLAGTPCKHLFLVETFDAWEPWDSIHGYPCKVSWEVWAYSHAAVRMPEGRVGRSAGVYISWMNRLQQLLPPETVALLSRTFQEAADDLRREPVPGGPCIVYHRPGLEASLASPTAYSRGEEMDDWVAMVTKYGVPALSITRSEWLSQVDPDGVILAAARAMDPEFCSRVSLLARRGTPILLLGQAGLIDADLRDDFGIPTEPTPRTETLPQPAIVCPCLTDLAGSAGLVINQRQRSLADGGAMSALIRCLDGPVFARHVDLPVWVWETPEWGTPGELHMTNQSIQSPQTYRAIASSFSEAGWGRERLNWQNDDWQKPVCFLFWRYASDELGVLLANLETGVTGNSQFCVGGKLTSARSLAEVRPTAIGAPGRLATDGMAAYVRLGAHKACLLER